MKVSLGVALALSLIIASQALPRAAWAQAPGVPSSHAGPRHALPQRGDFLPPDLLKAGSNVDQAAARLRRPPSGYGWFSLAGVIVLASLSTGLIVEVVAP